MGNDEAFYEKLSELTEFDQVVASANHHPAPDSWHVVVTDVRGSTVAIEAGRYKDVNALGVASIIALRNAVSDIELPYVFGGDGATILVPDSRLADVDCALRGMRKVATEAYSLQLRVSHVSVRRLREAGYPVFVGRYRMSPHVALAVFSGEGFSKAEEWIKDPVLGQEFAVSEDGPSDANLEGFECRWQPAKSRRGRMMSLLVVAVGLELSERENTYQQVLAALDRIAGGAGAPPFSQKQMRLKKWSGDFSTEARAISGKQAGAAFENAKKSAKKATLLGRLLVALGLKAGSFHGKKYRKEFLQNTDFRKFDEALRMVLDLTGEEIEKLDLVLRKLHQEKKLAYGMHLSDEALITCMVRSYSGDHVHFIDGSHGGYALAAKPLKAQLKELK